MNNLISDKLMARVARLAEAEGIDAAAYAVRCVADAVELAERTKAELDRPVLSKAVLLKCVAHQSPPACPALWEPR